MKRIIILLSLTGVIAFVGCKQHIQEKEKEVQFIVTSPVQLDTIINKSYVCQLHAINHIELRSMEKGYLQKIYVDEGQYVKKGQLMFQIMPVIYKAEKEKAQANVNYANIEFRNTKNLADSGIVSKNELALAKATLDKEKSELALAQAHLSFTEIRAPFDGIMDRFHERLGSFIEEGALLTTIADNSRIWAYFNVPEAEYLDYTTQSNKSEKQKVSLQMANSKVFDREGTVETIEADFNNETGNIAFRATFMNPRSILRHGETGNVLMPVQLKNALLIPQKATFEILDKKFVYVVDSSGVVQSRQITVGTEMPHIYQVTSGLSTGDKILVEGLRKVKNKQKIQSEFESADKIFSELQDLHAE